MINLCTRSVMFKELTIIVTMPIRVLLPMTASVASTPSSRTTWSTTLTATSTSVVRTTFVFCNKYTNMPYHPINEYPSSQSTEQSQ